MISSVLTINPSFGVNANFTYPSDPSDGNLSNTPSEGSINPDVSISGQNVYAIWRDGSDILFSNSADSGDTFSKQIIGSSSANMEPKLAVKDSNVFAIWLDDGVVEFNRSTNDGTTFGGAEVQLSSSTSTSRDPQITVSDGNDVYSVWTNDNSPDDIFFIKSSDNGVTFDTILDIGDSDSNHADPQITTSGNNVYVIWQTTNNIMFAQSANNGSSFIISDIGDSTGSSNTKSYPQVSTLGSFVYTVWQQGSDIKFAQSSDSGVSFSTPIIIGDSGGSLRESNLKLTSSGSDVYVVWRDGPLAEGDIKFAKSSDNGASFGTEINLSQNDKESSSPVISVSGSNVFVAWEDSTPSNGANKDILVSASDDGGLSFGNPITLINNDGDSTSPSIAISGNTALVSWQDSTPGVSEVFIKLGTILSEGISFDQTQYKLSDNATITITDEDSAGIGSILSTITSNTDTNGIDLTLSEGPSGTFTGTISFTESGNSSGTTLRTSAGDTITSSFNGLNSTALIFARSVDFGVSDVKIGSTVHPEAIDNNANLNSTIRETVDIQISSTANPGGITLTLTETGVDTGIFGGNSGVTKSNLIFTQDQGLVTLPSSVTIIQRDVANEGNSNTDPFTIENVTVTITSSSDSVGLPLLLFETDVDTGEFSGDLILSTSATDEENNSILVAQGDFITVKNRNGLTSKLLVEPHSPSDGALQAQTPFDTNITATYKNAPIATVTLTDEFSEGGGGGGLVRPSLVVNALAGIGGGGSAYSSPTLQLSNLVLLGQIDVPLEVEQMILNHDSTIPVPAMELNYFEDFTYPLRINDKGFILSGYSTTIETQILQTNTPHTFKFLFYESDKIQHFSLYTNLRDSNTEIYQSDTQILYNDGLGTEVVDPNGFFENVSLTVNEIDDLRKEVVLEITFANTMDTTDMIVRSWDPFLNSFDNYILKAISVVSDEIIESPITTYEQPVIEELKSETIPIWIKNNAAWWSHQQISDEDFIEGIEYLIKNEIINVPGVQIGSSSTSKIPDWIQNNAGWWAESLITDDDFIEAIQWLISNGVIQI